MACATARVNSSVVFQCFTIDSWRAAWANADPASKSSVNRFFVINLPRDIMDIASANPKATPEYHCGTESTLIRARQHIAHGRPRRRPLLRAEVGNPSQAHRRTQLGA